MCVIAERLRWKGVYIIQQVKGEKYKTMGLDMYLTAKLRTCKPYGNEREHPIRKVIKENLKEYFKSGNVEYIDISFEAGYWRKANHIHKWFVDNVQDGEDECKPYYVSRDALKKLELCMTVLNDKDKAKELLPTQEGFFFGGAEYDEYYFNDLKCTIMIIDKCLSLPETWAFECQSSW